MAQLNLPSASHLLRDQKTISASWDRCMNEHGLDQWSRRHETVVRRERVRDSIESLGPLFSACRSQVHHIFQNIVGSGHAVILTDKSGTIIEFEVQSALDALFRQAGLRRGADWSEAREGTNGIGTAIAEKKSLTVYRDQHFYNDHASLTCTGTPVFDVSGDVLALFDVSSIGRKDDPEILAHTRALLEMSARLMTRRNFQDHFSDQWILRFHRDAERVGLLEEGLLALDQNGKVVGADEQAMAHLALKDRSELIGVGVDQVFDADRDQLAAQLAKEGRMPARLDVSQRYLAVERDMHARLVEPKPASQGHHLHPVRKPAVRASLPTRPAPYSQKAGLGFVSRGTKPSGRSASPLSVLAGKDTYLKEIADKAVKLFNHDVPLLISGETGVGKDSFARALHESSLRAGKPFVAVNCGALPENLLEGELFGYKAGAFTGAQASGFKGQILAANGGTLLLDEIGDMPLSAQTRLLQVLERRQVTPLGSSEGVELDIRLLAATHQPLEALCHQGKFREDLYFRICGFTLSLPALRERQDIDDLVGRLLPGRVLASPAYFTEAAQQLLLGYHWPGNIRQLKHVLTTAAILADEGAIDVCHLQISDLDHRGQAGQYEGCGAGVAYNSFEGGLREPLDFSVQEKEAIEAALDRTRWNVSRAAAALGISRNTLYRKMRKQKISRSK